MEDKTVSERIDDIYFINRWGEGYFSIGDEGHLSVRPDRSLSRSTIDIKKVIDEIKERGVQLPCVVRFPEILRSQVIHLNETFKTVIDEADYKGRFMGVFPVKVNQMREVVEEIVDAGAPYDFGLEAGSKAELLSVLSLNTNKESLTILNGHKDREYLRLALLGRKLQRKMIVVVERFQELIELIELSKEMNVEPLIGLRAKISVKGSGKWSESGGEKAKFGLSVSEIMQGVKLLEENGLKGTVKLIHFHVGSQVVNIQTIKDAISEGTRIYSELIKLGVPIEYMDVGGGLGVDYDGSQSAHDSSRNYSTEIYASDIVYGIQQVCDLAGVKHPHIVTESGRAMTAHHSFVLVEVVDKIGPMTTDFREGSYDDLEKPHILVTNIKEILTSVHETPFQEVFNDALAVKTDAENAFRLGILSLGEKAIIEDHFWEICRVLRGKIKHLDFISEDFESFADNLALQYLCNFSVFQSLPDSWAIDQLFPVVPITRLKELPTEHCILVDITCDSDGKIDKFINLGKYKNTLQLHSLKEDEPYYLGFFLTGAYQDVMGDTHNLFGRLNEVHIFSDVDDPHGFYVEEVIRGASAKKVLNTMQYNAGQMAYNMKKEIDSFVGLKNINPRESVKLIDFFEDCLNGYTYLRGKEEE